MKILVVGFGGMGCRHAQSVLAANLAEKIYVVEPSAEIFEVNLTKIGASPSQIIRYNTVEEVKDQINLAVVATSSAPRFEIVKKLISIGVKKFLLEKILFQSEAQFAEILEELEKNKCEAYCNLPNRYFEAYNKVREIYRKKEITHFSMNVMGGDFGLACNSIHYIDLFSYITGENAKISSAQLEASEKENRRGSIYKEIVGNYSLTGSKGGELNIISNNGIDSPPIISISINSESFIFYEANQKAFYFSNGQTNRIDFTIIPSSKLTSVIIQDIMNGNCRLPSVQDLFSIHLEFFKFFNPAFNLKQTPNTLCPIT